MDLCISLHAHLTDYKYYNNGEAYNPNAGNEWKGSATYPEYGQAGIEAGSFGEAGKSGEASNYY